MMTKERLSGELGMTLDAWHKLHEENKRLRAGLSDLRGNLLNAGARCEGMKLEPGIGELINAMIDRVEALATPDEPTCAHPNPYWNATKLLKDISTSYRCPDCGKEWVEVKPIEPTVKSGESL